MHALPVATLFIYLIAAAVSLPAVYRKQQHSLFWLRGFLVFGLCLQTASLFFLYSNAALPVDRNGADYFFWVAWLLMAVLLVFWKQLNYPILNTLVSGAAGLFLVSSSYLVHLPGSASVLGESPYFLLLHIVPALVAEVCLVLAFILSVVFLAQDRRLKRKNLSGSAGPSLAFLDALQGRVLRAGFIAMSLAVLSGIFWALGRHIPLLNYDPRGLLAYVSWILLALLLQSRAQHRLSPRKIALLTVAVTGLVFGAIFFITFVSGQGLHGFSS